MLELPEAAAMAKQLGKAVGGRTIAAVTAGKTPHKFAFFNGDPEGYPDLLSGRTIRSAESHGGFVEVILDDVRLPMGDGVNLRYHPDASTVPAKHQLALRLDDGAFLVGTVQMYGAMMAFRPGEFDNPYYAGAVAKPSPLTGAFSKKHFRSLVDAAPAKLTTKGLLATEQRIPGLGNGCLQDILFTARLHPKAKVSSLTDTDVDRLYKTVTSVLKDMTAKGGRDTEKDLYGQPGGYRTILSAKTLGNPCPGCGGVVERQAYLGGNVYFCPTCQPM
ncbi:MAG: endonuclease VIII [Planctomycetes bacterium]|nr:endonuclease VIII [Planctomycetota bacterium]